MNTCRNHDYWLGGKDNFAADRELAEKFLQAVTGPTAYIVADAHDTAKVLAEAAHTLD